MMLDWEHWKTTFLLLTSLVAAGATGFALLKTRQHLRETQRQQQVLTAVSKVNNNFLLHKDPKRRFGELLEVLKELTGSPMGLIGERMEMDGQPFMRCYAITNLAWDKTSRALYDDNIEQGIDFFSLDNLFGNTLKSGEVIISNQYDAPPGGRRVPKGHPEIRSFIGIPLKFQGEVLGMFGLANAKSGYSDSLAEWLKPLTDTLTGLMYAFRIERAQREASHRMLLALNEAEDANQVKSDFLATMSHEIRTPLNAVVGMLDSLGNTQALSPEQRDYIRTADSAADTLLSLINDVLDFSKIEAGKLNLEAIPVNLCQQVDAVMSLAATTPGAHEIDLYFSPTPNTPLEIIGDPVRLRQILHNLINNAVKFTRQGHVSVSLQPCNPEDQPGDGISISVEDTGIGIAPEHQSIIFNAFRQADHSTTREYQGTGLGLAITRHLVEAMGGTISVTSRLGEGSRFTVSLPLQQHGSSTLASSLAQLPLSQCRVLCVSNSHHFYQFLYTLLSPHVACIDCHYTPLAEDAEAGGYDLLLVDDRRYPLDNDSLRHWIQQQSGQGELIVFSNRNLAELFIPVSAQIPLPLSTLDLLQALTALYRPELLPPETQGLALPDGPDDNLASITQGLNILIAEDHPVNRKMMEVLMERAGAEYTLCGDGLEVLDALNSDEDYDLILMDLHMPNLDGFDTTEAIRALPSPLSGIPIIAVTADALSGDREKCLTAGMDDYLAKPVRLTDLQRVISRTLAASFMPANEIVEHPAQPEAVDFDAEGLISELGGTENAVLLIHEFAASLHTELSRIEQALSNSDNESASSASHRVKGSARTLRCGLLAKQLETVEHFSRAGQTDQARSAYTALQQDLPALELKLLRFCAQHLHHS
ncbi:hypothetical protein GCM10009104_21100 [Marinobacterium maritimum]|uniref:histidine kinase n=1 Tax=Marinobacterium maritimum TaxID=500162 RepID=A0ABP3T9T5_9GAMM